MNAPQRLAVLVVDDDRLARKVLASHLEGHEADFCEDAASARAKLSAGRYDVCFIDLDLGDGKTDRGLELVALAASRGAYPVVMSAHDSEAVVEQAYALGCADFYAKGDPGQSVAETLARFRRRRPPPEELFKASFVTQDPQTRAAVLQALNAAASEVPILILGPSGTGKTSLARVVHEHSGRPGAFVALNCAAFAEDLLEAELFGYRKGAFTGAGDGRKGKLLLADGGTLFLDEIGAMGQAMQAKLLKAIEERSFYPLGCDRPETSRFRLISATLEDPAKLSREGRLRFDFYQRVQGLTVRLKPLRERPGDVLPLIEAFSRGGRRLAFSAEAKAALLSYPWPGNAREVRRFVELAAASCRGRVEAGDAARMLGSPAAAGPLAKLIHDVEAKCSSLRQAAALLPSSSPDEAAQLLRLMREQAQSLARALEAFSPEARP